MFIPQTQPHAQSLFLFPTVFGINLSLSLSLSLSLYLSPSLTHAQYRKRFRTSYNDNVNENVPARPLLPNPHNLAGLMEIDILMLADTAWLSFTRGCYRCVHFRIHRCSLRNIDIRLNSLGNDYTQAQHHILPLDRSGSVRKCVGRHCVFSSSVVLKKKKNLLVSVSALSDVFSPRDAFQWWWDDDIYLKDSPTGTKPWSRGSPWTTLTKMTINNAYTKLTTKKW